MNLSKADQFLLCHCCKQARAYQWNPVTCLLRLLPALRVLSDSADEGRTTSHNKGSSFNTNHFKACPQLNGPTTAEQLLTCMRYTNSFNGKPVATAAQKGKPVERLLPKICWAKACFGVNPLHTYWQSCLREAEYYVNLLMRTR